MPQYSVSAIGGAPLPYVLAQNGQYFNYTIYVNNDDGNPYNTTVYTNLSSSDNNHPLYGIIGLPVTRSANVNNAFFDLTASTADLFIHIQAANTPSLFYDLPIVNGLRDAIVTVGNSSVVEGNTGTSFMAYTVSRTGNVNGRSFVDYLVGYDTGANAADANDFAFDAAHPQSGRLEFAANELQKTLLVPIRGDAVKEGNETFHVTLSNAVAAKFSADGTVASIVGTGTILDDDTPLIVSDTASPATGAYTVGQTITFTLAIDRAVAVTGAPFLTLNDGGTAGYVAASSTGTSLVFRTTVAAGQDVATLAVTGVNLNGGTIRDPTGNDAALGGANATFAGLSIDTLAPGAPSTPDLLAASDDGVSNTDNVTTVATPTFAGNAEANATVRLYDTDGVTVLGSTMADAGGAWSITSAFLRSGVHTITSRASDAAGNISSASAGLAVTIPGQLLVGDAGPNDLRAGDFDDTLVGGAGTDSLDGGAGTHDVADYSGSAAGVVVSLALGRGSGGDAAGDTLIRVEDLVGSAFNDGLVGDAGANRLSGGAGDDYLVGGAGPDTLDGGAGPDTVSYATSSTAVIANLATGRGTGGDAEGDVLINVERLVGSAFNDGLIGDAGPNVLLGLDGDDYLVGGAGADYIDGGAGPDTVSYATSSAAVSINLTAGTARGGDAEGDTLLNVERVVGSNFNDVLIGSAAGDVLLGGAGNDTLLGSGGMDYLFGGSGADYFVFEKLSDSRVGAARDIIEDFSRAEGDKIFLGAITNGGYSFIGSGAFSGGGAHEVQASVVDVNSVLVSLDTGDGQADFELLVIGTNLGLTGLSRADFVL